jgi:hypothetical protein
MVVSFLVLIAAETATAAAIPVTLAEPDVMHMAPRDIKGFNMSVPKSHPYYIRCVASVETGSLIKTKRVCKTNQQWRLSDERGNQDARDTYDRFESKAAVAPQ